jgi:hypothetical protein
MRYMIGGLLCVVVYDYQLKFINYDFLIYNYQPRTLTNLPTNHYQLRTTNLHHYRLTSYP